MSYIVRPIDVWPGERGRHRRSQFKASWSNTASLLERELRHLGARNTVILVDVVESDIRIDGMLRANARPGYPGVIIAFDSKHGPLKYMSDAFDDWQDNVRAIALGLEALRRVDRCGITKRGEQYTGWRQIEQHAGTGFASADQAVEWMVDKFNELGIVVTIDKADPGEAYRQLARYLHPDAPSGSHDEFVKLQQARELIEA